MFSNQMFSNKIFSHQMFHSQMFNQMFRNQMFSNQPGSPTIKSPDTVKAQTGVLLLFLLTINETNCKGDFQRKAKSRVVFGVFRTVPDNSLTSCANPGKLCLVAPRQLLLFKLIQLR